MSNRVIVAYWRAPTTDLYNVGSLNESVPCLVACMNWLRAAIGFKKVGVGK